MGKKFEFTPFKEYAIDIEKIETECEPYDIFRNKYSWHYSQVNLPPGYVGFMDFGPKVLAGDWAELVMRIPIVMLLIVIAIVIPIMGILYCVLNYMHKCTRPYSSERPVERVFRFVLCIILIVGILAMISSLYTSYLGILSLRSMSLSLKEFPSTREFLDHTIEQIKHIFTINRNEIIKEGKDLITINLHRFILLADKNEESFRNGRLKILNENLYYLREYAKSKINLSDNDHVNIHFIRDLFRLSYRITADHFKQMKEEKPTNDELYYADYLEGFLNPRALIDYNTALDQINKLADVFNDDIQQLNLTFNACLDEAHNVLQEYGTTLTDELEKYFHKRARYRKTLISAIEKERDIESASKRPKGTHEIYIPHRIFYTTLWCMYTIVIIILTLIIGLVVGILGPRGPRDNFGFNKTTASKILSAVVIAIFSMYTLSAIAGIRLFLYALVIGNGVCKIQQEAIGASVAGVALSIFHTCETTDTVYKKLISSERIDPIIFKFNIASKFNEDIWAKWAEAGKIKLIAKKKTNVTVSDSLRFSPKFYELAAAFEDLRTESKIEDYANDYTKEINTHFRNEGGTYVLIENEGANGSALWTRPCIIENFRNLKKTIVPQFLLEHLHNVEVSLVKYRKYFPGGIEKCINDTIVGKVELPLYYDKTIFIQQMTKHVEDFMNQIIAQYEVYIKNALEVEIGHCGLYSDIEQKRLHEACKCILAPLDSSWTGYFLILFLLPGMLVAAIALSNNFAKVSYDYTPVEETYDGRIL